MAVDAPPPGNPVFRAPMRSRELDVPPTAGAAFGVAHGQVGIGPALDEPPASLAAAVAAVAAARGEKAGRMLSRFAGLPDGVLVWTRDPLGFRLGRVTGPWRYDASPEAAAVGIHHVRPAAWLEHVFGTAETPAATVATVARGGRNLQRIHGPGIEAASERLWSERAREDSNL